MNYCILGESAIAWSSVWVLGVNTKRNSQEMIHYAFPLAHGQQQEVVQAHLNQLSRLN